MDKRQLIAELENFKIRLNSDVINAYQRDEYLGSERFEAWKRAIKKFLNNNFSGYYSKLYSKLNPACFTVYNDVYTQFIEDSYRPSISFIDSLILDIKNDELDLNPEKNAVSPKTNKKDKTNKLAQKAFIVHGHDEAAKEKTARFLENLGFQAIILHEQPNKGKTIIEKLEHYIDLNGFGVVLYTPDDKGASNNDARSNNYKSRSRQNVVFEHGWLIGALGRERVIQVVTDHSIEFPSDLSGVIYLDQQKWELDFANEIEAMGYDVDFNLLKKKR